MFRVVPVPIIRCQLMYIRTFGTGTCYTGLMTASFRQTCITCASVECKDVQQLTPDDGQRNYTKHVEFCAKINLETSASVNLIEKPLLDTFSYHSQDDHHVTTLSYRFIQNIRSPHPHLLQSQNEGTTCCVHLRILLHILFICYYRLLMSVICFICSENNKWIIILTENLNRIREFGD